MKFTSAKEKIEENKYLIVMNLPKEELEKFSLEDKVVSKYMDKLNRINEDPVFFEFYEEGSKRQDLKREEKIRNQK